MGNRSYRRFGLFLLLCAVLGLSYAATVNAQDSSNQNAEAGPYQPARPVYLDVRPIAGADTQFDKGLVEAMAQEALSSIDESVIRMRGNKLPPSVRVLRVMYIVHEQPTSTGIVMAGTAKIDLLRTQQDRSDAVLATSIYSGVQQSLIQGATEQGTLENLRAAFKKSLTQRIKQAFTNSAAN